MDFVAIDFETATFHKYSACAIGIVTVENNKIADEYYTLIRLPHNEYNWQNIPKQLINQQLFSSGAFGQGVVQFEDKSLCVCE